MIRKDQLRIQIDRLIDTYGDKAFSEQREHLIWEAVEGLEYAQVIKIVDDFIRKSRNAPLPQDFIESAKEYQRHSQKRPLGEERELPICIDCRDSGLVEIVRKSEYEPWAVAAQGDAACHCERGRLVVQADARSRFPAKLTQFNDLWRTSYRIKRKSEGAMPLRPLSDNDDGGGAA